MNRQLFYKAILCVLCAGAAWAEPVKHLVIISIDGLRPVEYSQASSTMPALAAMARSGCASTGVTAEFPSVTFPNHTTMMTGQPPAVHGVVSNALLDPFNVTPGGLYYFAGQIHAPTLWDAVHEHGGSTAAINWPVTVGARIDYLIPDYKDFRNESELAMERVLSTPGLLADIELHTAPIQPGSMDDAWRAHAAAYVFARYKPALLLLHLIESDEAQHEYAPGSPQAIQTLRHLDGLVRELREQVERAAGNESVTWLIVSDHGFQAYERMFHPLAALHSLGYLTYSRPGRLQDWHVEARLAGGSAALVARDPDDKEAIERTTAYFRFLATQPQFGIRRLYTREELARLNAFPDAFLAFDMASGFASGGNTDGELVTVEAGPHGAHGYDPANPNMRASFVLYGANVATCKSLDAGRVADVAPTAAALLGFEFPPSTGRVRTEAFQQ
jgi:predicted AlkP superfamily pyrophosphatase or phosphodiesterase